MKFFKKLHFDVKFYSTTWYNVRLCIFEDPQTLPWQFDMKIPSFRQMQKRKLVVTRPLIDMSMF